MDRERALAELKARLTNKNLIKHSLAVEAIMHNLASHFCDSSEIWAMAGLLHDIDYEKTIDKPEAHGIVGAEILENLGLDEEITYAIKAHNSITGVSRNRKIDKALYSADPVSGLIIAGALILPSKKLADVTVDFLLKRMTEKSFAKGANREQIKQCEDLGLSLEEFLGISLKAMQGIAAELGL